MDENVCIEARISPDLCYRCSQYACWYNRTEGELKDNQSLNSDGKKPPVSYPPSVRHFYSKELGRVVDGARGEI